MMQEPLFFRSMSKSAGCFSPAVRLGDYVYISGQLPLDHKRGVLAGETIEEQTRMVIQNIGFLLKEAGLDLRYVLKTTIYLQDVDDFQAFNKVYMELFQLPYPAASIIGVSSLPYGAKIEIDAFAIDTRALEVICASECAGNACGI